jgi:hypothetical protein
MWPLWEQLGRRSFPRVAAEYQSDFIAVREIDGGDNASHETRADDANATGLGIVQARQSIHVCFRFSSGEDRCLSAR